jgi:hypothetical protein
MTMQLSEKAQELISKARIVSFSSWKGVLSGSAIALFQAADDQGRYLTSENLEQIKAISPNLADSVAKARLLTEKTSEIVEQARAAVLTTFPNITDIGGELYPPERAQACWRDFWHFLRCITYGIAGNKAEFTSTEGLANMRLLYQELEVPLGAMVCGVENLKKFSLQEFSSQEQELIAPHFDHLINALKAF